MAKPSDFYVGLVDFFAILLPGAIAVAVLHPWVGASVLDAVGGEGLPASARWVAFLLAAYFLGHIVFMAGARLDGGYNDRRKRRLAEAKANPHLNQEELKHEQAYQAALGIQEVFLTGGERDTVNAFQWSSAILTADFPEAAANVQRYVADSKFFRSLLIVLPVAALVLLLRGAVLAAVGAGVLTPFCYMRYYEQRMKSTTMAYRYIITFHRLGRLQPPGPPPADGAPAPDVSPDDAEA